MGSSRHIVRCFFNEMKMQKVVLSLVRYQFYHRIEVTHIPVQCRRVNKLKLKLLGSILFIIIFFFFLFFVVRPNRNSDRCVLSLIEQRPTQNNFRLFSSIINERFITSNFSPFCVFIRWFYCIHTCVYCLHSGELYFRARGSKYQNKIEL